MPTSVHSSNVLSPKRCYDWFRSVVIFLFPCFQAFFRSFPIQSRFGQWAQRKSPYLSEIWLAQVLSTFIFLQLWTQMWCLRVQQLWFRHKKWGNLAEIKYPSAYRICDYLMSNLFHHSSMDNQPNLIPGEECLLKSMQVLPWSLLKIEFLTLCLCGTGESQRSWPLRYQNTNGCPLQASWFSRKINSFWFKPLLLPYCCWQRNIFLTNILCLDFSVWGKTGRGDIFSTAFNNHLPSELLIISILMCICFSCLLKLKEK